MKSKGQILKHLTEVGYTKNARTQICAYLVGKGIKERDEVIAIKKGNGTFDEFLKWENYEDKTQKITLNPTTTHWTFAWVKEHNPEPKYKVGDWVRFFDSDSVVQIKHFTDDGDYFFTANGSWLPLKDVNPYYPKEGEFFVIGERYIAYLREYFNGYGYDLHTDATYYFEKESTNPNKYRPATESEIQLLKDKVKEKYNKEWNGKEWVEIKKSDKELFEEWKKDNVSCTRRLQQYSINPDYMEKKLVAYTELYLFAQWVNQFYEKSVGKWGFVIYVDTKLHIDDKTWGDAYGEINFATEEAAQRAIDCLGEELIKTALK